MNAYLRENPATSRQLEVLGFIANFTDRNGYCPSIRAIGVRFGIASTNGVNDNLRALERKGLLCRVSRTARALVVTEEGRRWLSPPKPALVSGSEVA